MSLFDVNFQVLNDGLGRVLAGDDSVSGFVFTDDVKPSGLAKTIVVYSLAEAVAAGIVASGTTAELNFHVTNFFLQVTAPLYITFSAGDLAHDLHDLQSEAEGTIKQIAVIDPTGAFSTAAMAVLNTAAVQANADHAGYSVLYTGAFSVALSALPSLTGYDYPKVSVLVGADGPTGYSCIGATLGTVALAKVSENIGYVRQFNVVKSSTFETLAFSTGESYKSVSAAQLSQVKDKGYIFLRKYTGKSGSFHSDSSTATSSTSDYAYIENNRTMEKAQRGLRAALVDELGSTLPVSDSGNLTVQTLAKFDLLVRNVLDTMKASGELSAFEIFIDPAQPVLSTSKLVIRVGIVPLGVARQIVVPIGLEVKVSSN